MRAEGWHPPPSLDRAPCSSGGPCPFVRDSGQMEQPIEPHQHIRIVLSEARRRGYPFAEAWTVAMRSLPRNHPEIEVWRDALVWARPWYADAYYRDDPAEHLRRTETRLEREVPEPVLDDQCGDEGLSDEPTARHSSKVLA
jgi:hypothetical protein